MAYKIITPATVEPITLEEARKHLRIEAFGSPLEHPDDDYINTCITVAREFCEQYLERALAAHTIQMALDDFPSQGIPIPLAPTVGITSVIYVDTDDAEQTVATSVYALDDYSEPNWIVLKAGQRWPVTNQGANNVKILMTVGYAPTNVPAPIKAAMLLIIGNQYENRQQDVLGNTRISFNSLPLGVYNLLQPYRLGMGM